MDDGSVTHWINEIKDGNREAVEGLWQRYFMQLVRLAGKSLNEGQQRVADEEDVALSTMNAFCLAAEQGKFPDLSDRSSLWRLLVRITARKAVNQNRRLNRQRRGGGKVRGHSALGRRDVDNDPQALAQVIGKTPSPEFAVMVKEELTHLLDFLEESNLKELALAKMEGHTNAVIAKQFGCSERTIERRLKLIRVKCDEKFLR